MTVPRVIKYGMMAIISIMFIMSRIKDHFTGHDKSLGEKSEFLGYCPNFEVMILT